MLFAVPRKATAAAVEQIRRLMPVYPAAIAVCAKGIAIRGLSPAMVEEFTVQTGIHQWLRHTSPPVRISAAATKRVDDVTSTVMCAATITPAAIGEELQALVRTANEVDALRVGAAFSIAVGYDTAAAAVFAWDFATAQFAPMIKLTIAPEGRLALATFLRDGRRLTVDVMKRLF